MLLYNSVVFFVSLRYVWNQSINKFNRCIGWISRLSIMFGVMALIVVLSVMNGFECALKRNYFCFFPHALLTTHQGYISDILNKPEIISSGLQCHIIHIEPIVISDIILQSTQGFSCGMMLGIYPNCFEPLSKYLICSNIEQLIPENYFVILGSVLAKRLGIKINDQVRIIVPSILQNTFFGNIPSQRLFTVLDIFHTNSEADNDQILLNHIDAAKIMCYPSEHCFTGWRVWLRDPFILKDFNNNKFQLSNNWIWKDWRENKGSIFRAINMEKKMIFLLFSLIIIAAGFSIISFLVLLVTEKKIEIAVLKACGFTHFQIMSVFMIQGVINGIIGIFLGTGLGILISKKFNYILSLLNIFIQCPLFPIEIQYFQIFVIVMVTFFLILMSVFFPSWKTASIDPSKILCHE